MMSSAWLPCPAWVTALVLTVICTHPFFAVAGGVAWQSVTLPFFGWLLCRLGAADAAPAVIIAIVAPSVALAAAAAIARRGTGRRASRGPFTPLCMVGLFLRGQHHIAGNVAAS